MIEDGCVLNGGDRKSLKEKRYLERGIEIACCNALTGFVSVSKGRKVSKRNVRDRNAKGLLLLSWHSV